ncbi:MAG: FG-GAP repeat protein, partial [Polyangiaceae bacterium]|nr:FG-GAP repeat protein [Polyangiaceae bacterium]
SEGGAGAAGMAGAATGGTETGGTGGTETGGSTETGGAETAGTAGAGGVETTCAISHPVFTPLHPALNGVPVASGGDRVSSPGALYQARVEVQTNSPDGQWVRLYVDHGLVASSVVASGLAAFPGVTFDPDGDYTVQAACESPSGTDVNSAEMVFKVDTTPPSLAVTKVTPDGESALVDADHFGPHDDMDLTSDGLQMLLCGTTTSLDAIDLDPPRDNFSILLLPARSVLGAGPVQAVPNNGACVLVGCPGSGAFDIVLALEDAAGNPTEITRNNITCASADPLVSLVDPVSDAPGFAHPLIVADDTQPTVEGAQYTVVACTNAPVGSDATLSSGLVGGGLAPIATATVEEDSSGGPCDTSQLNRLVFVDAELTPSAEDPSSYELTDATRLEVSVTDSGTLGVGTDSADVWVDMTAPELLETSELCGVEITSAVAETRTLTFSAPLASVAHPVTVLVTDQEGDTQPFYGTGLVGGQCDVEVTFPVGANTWTASVTEPSGNTGSVGPCSVIVSPAPLPEIDWLAPAPQPEPIRLIAKVDLGDEPPAGNVEQDADPDTADWQGDLSVQTSLRDDDASSVSVTFTAVSADGLTTTDLGVTDINPDDGVATLFGATVPEGMSLRLKARTSAGAAPSAVSTIIVDVDVTAPGEPTNLSVDAPVAVDDPRRRVSTMGLDWTSGGGATGYQIYMDQLEITPDVFGDEPQTGIDFSGQPQPGGMDESLDVTGLYVENDYFFALRAVDDVGNRSPVVATTVAARAPLYATDIESPEGPTALVEFGAVIAGSSNFNGNRNDPESDGYSDVLVGEYMGTTAYLYLGGPDGVATTPAVTFHENEDEAAEVTRFGFSLAGIGDLNGDGIEDIAIGSYNEADQDGAVYVFYGSTSWSTSSPISLYASDTDGNMLNADVKVMASRVAEPRYERGWLGMSVARLGDFDGDKKDDFAVGVPHFRHTAGVSTYLGQVAVVLGGDDLPSGTVLELSTAFSDGDAIRIDGEVDGGRFGTNVAGLGRFYDYEENPVLIASAPYVAAGGLTSAGRIYAVQGESASSISLGGVPHLDGSIANERLGSNGLFAVGDLGPSGNLALGIASPYEPPPGRAYVYSGTPVQGPFAASIGLAPAADVTDTAFGRCIVGGIVPGTGTPVSFIGDERSDLIVSSFPTGSPHVYVIDGAKIGLDGGEATVDTVAQVAIPLPGDWAGFASQVTALRDVDDDGFGDFAVGDMKWTSPLNPGRIRVYR